MTLVDGVLSLPPGHTLTIELDSDELDSAESQIKIESYWNMAAAARSNGHTLSANTESQSEVCATTNVDATNGRAPSVASRPRAPGRVRELLEESVRLHMIADVPVGVFLSSGIDSTAIAALARREVGDVHTFTVAFKEQQFNEAAVARRTAQQLGTRAR